MEDIDKLRARRRSEARKGAPYVRAAGPGRFEAVDPHLAHLPPNDPRVTLARAARSPVADAAAALNFARASTPEDAKRVMFSWSQIRQAAGSSEGSARLRALGVEPRHVITYETPEGFASLNVVRPPEQLLREVAAFVAWALAEASKIGVGCTNEERAQRAISEAFGGVDVEPFMPALQPVLKLRQVTNRRKAERRRRAGKL